MALSARDNRFQLGTLTHQQTEPCRHHQAALSHPIACRLPHLSWNRNEITAVAKQMSVRAVRQPQTGIAGRACLGSTQAETASAANRSAWCRVARRDFAVWQKFCHRRVERQARPQAQRQPSRRPLPDRFQKLPHRWAPRHPPGLPRARAVVTVHPIQYHRLPV
jgi:hypothetical protein